MAELKHGQCVVCKQALSQCDEEMPFTLHVMDEITLDTEHPEASIYKVIKLCRVGTEKRDSSICIQCSVRFQCDHCQDFTARFQLKKDPEKDDWVCHSYCSQCLSTQRLKMYSGRVDPFPLQPPSLDSTST